MVQKVEFIFEQYTGSWKHLSVIVWWPGHVSIYCVSLFKGNNLFSLVFRWGKKKISILVKRFLPFFLKISFMGKITFIKFFGLNLFPLLPNYEITCYLVKWWRCNKLELPEHESSFVTLKASNDSSLKHGHVRLALPSGIQLIGLTTIYQYYWTLLDLQILHQYDVGLWFFRFTELGKKTKKNPKKNNQQLTINKVFPY